MKSKILHAGIDIGSTTTKIVAIDPKSGEVLYSEYRRHHASQSRIAAQALLRLQERFPESEFGLVLTGSGAKLLAEKLDLPYIQAVVANSTALQRRYETIGTAIELGGQDAQILLFREK